MDPALVNFDFAKAGAILADMVASYLAAGVRRDNQGENGATNRMRMPQRGC